MTRSGEAAGIRVGLGRSNLTVVIAMIAFLGGISGVAIYGSIKDPSAPLGFYLGGLFSLVLLYFLAKVPAFLKPRAFEFGPDGFRFWHGNDAEYIPWGEISAIGIGYQAKPADPRLALRVPGPPADETKDRIQGYATERAQEILHVSDKRRIGLEIYPMAPDLFARHPRLKPYIKALAPPGSPASQSSGWRLPLPPVVAIAQEASRGAQTFAPTRWLGWYARQWSA
jgi:hypothetical protein